MMTNLVGLVKRKFKTDTPFHKLSSSEKREILDYIQKRGLCIRALGQRWYDIISNKFYVLEYSIDESSLYGVKEQKIEFCSFEVFYDYVEGKIYDYSCFFGFVFTDEMIEKYNIRLEELNFDSYTSDVIDNHTYRAFSTKRSFESTAIKLKLDAAIQYFNERKQIRTIAELERTKNKFTSYFDYSYHYERLFFTLLLTKKKIEAKQLLMEYACKSEGYGPLSFVNILFNYGRNEAVYVLNNYVGGGSYSSNRKYYRRFKNILKVYDNSSYVTKRKVWFDNYSFLFYVADNYYDKSNCFASITMAFGTFEDLASFLNFDLSGADLSCAKISERKLSICKTDQSTKMPLDRESTDYVIMKFCDSENYVVRQEWENKQGDTIHSDEQIFTHFFDFVHFLKGDLSNADLIMCNGASNIKDLKGIRMDGIKVRSADAKQLNIRLNIVSRDNGNHFPASQIDKNEMDNHVSMLPNHEYDDDYSLQVSYITDIHLLHKFITHLCITYEDEEYVINTILNTIVNECDKINIFCGDLTSDFLVYESFIEKLKRLKKTGHHFFTLGNHEMWPFAGYELDDIINIYRNLFVNHGHEKRSYIHLVHNNIYYFSNGQINEITEKDLNSISEDDLRRTTRDARLIIFGGIGFAGHNESFNANDGIYRDSIDRETEIKQSNIFLNLYNKVCNALYGKNVIICTHMPLKDWGGQEHIQEGFLYISGHDHKNTFFDDGKKRIYADNQIGYKRKNISLKHASVDFDYDWFSDYKDGIFEIEKEDYLSFYRGIGEEISFSCQYKNLYMIKRSGVYLFLVRNLRNELLMLNGGVRRKIKEHDLSYFYDKVINYSMSIRLFLSKYTDAQARISREIKRIGGSGLVHGSIIDIDYYNHIYLNPLDGTITPYFAYSMVEKYVYENIGSLLKYECPVLYSNLEKIIDESNEATALLIYEPGCEVSNKKTAVFDTSMYKVSRILKGLQFTIKHNVVRLWNDILISEASESFGKQVLTEMISLCLLDQGKIIS